MKETGADAGLVRPVGSVAVAVTDCLPAVRPPAGAQLHAPEADATAVHSVPELSVTVTVASGSAVPAIGASRVADWLFFGVEITGPGGSAVVNLESSGKLGLKDLLSHDSLILPPH